MKRLFYLLFLLPGFLGAQEERYQFTDIKVIPATPVKRQDNTGTCWSFSTASFIESEAMRLGKGAHDLSEMFAVRHIYRRKCENYVRRQGTANLGQGGLSHDFLQVVKEHGIVPESVYPGRQDPAKPFDHTELEKNLKSLCDAFVEQGKKGRLDPRWTSRIDSLLDAEFGPLPNKFTYNNAVFTPFSFRDYLEINPEDYLHLTSFTHHPFWEPFVLEVPDNFANGAFYNLPLNEMIRTVNFSLNSGYSVEWDADVSNSGFSRDYGIAIVPEREGGDKASTDSRFQSWEPEKAVNQAYRQDQFDRQVTQDDHLMHIVGLLDEANSGNYYLVKNSWGEISERKGMVYVSEAYFRLNTLSVTVHKTAVPGDILHRLGITIGETKTNDPRNMPRSQSLEQTPAPAPTPGRYQARPPGRSSEIKAAPTKKD